MNLKRINNLVLTSMLSIAAANFAFAAESKDDSKTKSDIVHEVIGNQESAYGEVKGYIATKSSTGSKMDVDITEIPQSVSVITNDMMRTRAVSSIQNVTAYDASINQTYGENGDIRTNYGNIRGLDTIYKSSFLDNLKLVYYSGAIAKIDPYSLERVEILKGPSSVLYGASGPGGLLNQQSKKANEKESKEVGLAYSSYNNKEVFADINHKVNDKVLVRLTSKFKKGDNELDKSSNESYFFNPSLTYLISDETTIDLYASIAKSQTNGLGLNFGGAPAYLNVHNSVVKHITSFGLPLFMQTPLINSANLINSLNLPKNFFIGLPDEEINEKEQKTFSSILNSNINNNLKITSALRFMDVNNDTNYSTPSSNQANFTAYLTGGDLTKLPMEFIEVAAEAKSVVIDNNLEYKWGNSSFKNTSIFGLDIQHLKGNYTVKEAVQYTFDIQNPNQKINILKSNTYTKKESTKTTQIGLYTSNNMKIHEDYILSTSLRYDTVKNKIRNTVSNDYKDLSDDNISSRIGFVYKLENGFSPYISYSSSFQNNIGTQNDGKAFVPSIGSQLETGVKYQAKDNALFASLAFFNLQQEDALETDPNDSNARVQNSTHEVKGIEFNIIATPIDNTNVTFSFAKLKSNYKKSENSDLYGKKLGNTPDTSASIWVDYTFNNTKVGDLKLGAGIKYVGKSLFYQTDHIDPTKPTIGYEVQSYTVTDTAISTNYDNWNLSFNIYNLFDKEARLADNAISASSIAERTFKLTASYKF